MKYVDEFRNGELARALSARIAREAGVREHYRLMEFCGGHTHAISRDGLIDLLPQNVTMVHGPGCPVCVLPIGRIDGAIALARRTNVTLCTYADTMRIPASGALSLSRAKAAGADIRMVYSCQDALRIAREDPGRDVVFFAIGFETTAPPTALAIRQARDQGLDNFSVLCNHVLTPPAITHLLAASDARAPDTVALDGIIGPAHVSMVIGSRAYEHLCTRYRRPVVIAGFEPLDIMQAILMLVRQLNSGRATLENEFSRAVTPDGNVKAKALMADVFELRSSFDWRGLGQVAQSALRIREPYRRFDAEDRFGLVCPSVPDHTACECGAVLRGVRRPAQCRAFGTVCTPENPIGACMVSSEGACAAHYLYGRFRDTSEARATAPVSPEHDARTR